MDENAAPGARPDCDGLYLLLVSRADEAPRAPSAVKWSRASQPEPMLRGCWRQRLCFCNVWARGGGESFQCRRRGRKALRLLRQWMLAG